MPYSQTQEVSTVTSNPVYVIRRKGSRYNIIGPEGRIFTKYKSASIVGPRWEELTLTPWPYPSSAYVPGFRLWELGKTQEVAHTSKKTPRPATTKHIPNSTQETIALIPQVFPLALPAPRINLDEHKQLLLTLRRNPVLLLEPYMRQALQDEVDYHLPDAKWAKHLLKLLARYDRRQNHQPRLNPRQIMEKHIAWQSQAYSSAKR